jgi:serine/threonine-protein kinase RsbW
MRFVARQDSVATVVRPSHEVGVTRLRLALTLPRAATTLPTVRALLDAALTLVGAAEGCRGDLAVALTEACTNAIVHADGSAGYTVGVTLSGGTCVIDVSDTGVGLNPLALDGDVPDRLTDGGRGLLLMRRCTDTLELRPVRRHGLAVRMCKDLTYAA